MSPLFPLAVLLKANDLAGFTFLLGTLAMFGATVFFVLERSQVPPAWRTSLLVAAIVTMIAGFNYALMSAVWLTSHTSPMELRYLDWFLTVPLICLQFFLLLDAVGAQPSRGMVWRLVGASVWMLSLGYVGQEINPEQTVLWGALSTLGYSAILLEMSLGEANRLSKTETDARVKRAYDVLFRFIFIGWAIYPLGYMMAPGNLLSRLQPVVPTDMMYNVGDVINKVGFGLVIWRLAKPRESTATPEGMAPAPLGGLPRRS